MSKFRIALTQNLIEYYIVEAENAEEAIERYQAGEGEFDYSELEPIEDSLQAEEEL